MLLFAVVVCSASPEIQSAEVAQPQLPNSSLDKQWTYDEIMKKYPSLLDAKSSIDVTRIVNADWLESQGASSNFGGIYTTPRTVALILDKQKILDKDLSVNELLSRHSFGHSPFAELDRVFTHILFPGEILLNSGPLNGDIVLIKMQIERASDIEFPKPLPEPSLESLNIVLKAFNLIPRGRGVKLPAEGSSKKLDEQMKQRAAEEKAEEAEVVKALREYGKEWHLFKEANLKKEGEKDRLAQHQSQQQYPWEGLGWW